MTEWKLFGTPQFHDEAWYQDREAVDHIHQDGPNLGHRLRLLEALKLIDHIVTLDDLELKTLADWGAGNGGLLSEVAKKHPQLKIHGVDLCPANVAYGRKKYGLDLTLENIVDGDPRRGEIIVLTELLEHLVSPHDLVQGILEDPPIGETRWIVASTPGFEDFRNHYEYHLWAWTGDSFADMFTRAGWVVKRHFTRAEAGTQFVVAMSPELL